MLQKPSNNVSMRSSDRSRTMSDRGCRLTCNGSFVCAEVFDELDALRLLFPELEVPIHAASDQEVCRLQPHSTMRLTSAALSSVLYYEPRPTTCALRGQLP